MVETLQCHLQDLHELLLLPESVLQLPDPLVLLVLHVAPVQVVHTLTPVIGCFSTFYDFIDHNKRHNGN